MTVTLLFSDCLESLAVYLDCPVLRLPVTGIGQLRFSPAEAKDEKRGKRKHEQQDQEQGTSQMFTFGRGRGRGEMREEEGNNFFFQRGRGTTKRRFYRGRRY